MSEPHGTYGVGRRSADRSVAAPDLPYLPRDPERDLPGIGLVGCGGIAGAHLGAYRRAGYRVLALCDVDGERAISRQREFFPEARVHTDWRALLAEDGVSVVDVLTHPEQRVEIVEQSLRAGKHVLSQKPFVNDLDVGEKLIALADDCGVRLAVNQNGRFAPHFSWIRQAVAAGLIGTVATVDVAIHWDHGWTAGTPFDDTPHLLLLDFGIHWFDLLCVLFQGGQPRRVRAEVGRTVGQRSRQPLLARAVVEFENGRGTLVFNGGSRFVQRDVTVVTGTAGALVSSGPDLDHQAVTLHTAEGVARPELVGSWFENGFHGAMAELLVAIEENRRPSHSARDNLASLALCFAACESSLTGEPRIPGEVRRVTAPAGPDQQLERE